MSIIFVERKCIECGTKLTPFEVDEKHGFCMNCSKEREEPKMTKPFSLRDYKKKKRASPTV